MFLASKLNHVTQNLDKKICIIMQEFEMEEDHNMHLLKQKDVNMINCFSLLKQTLRFADNSYHNFYTKEAW